MKQGHGSEAVVLLQSLGKGKYVFGVTRHFLSAAPMELWDMAGLSRAYVVQDLRAL